MSFNWKKVKDYSDIIYEKIEDPVGGMDGIAKITINRPEVRNAFRPETVTEMYDAFSDARMDETIGVILINRIWSGKRWQICFFFRRRSENSRR